MSQENNFIPNQENYKPLTPFQLFVKSNFPFIENTFESLDNYGLYCKIVEYLNTVIENENTVESNVQELYDAFVSLNTYVSDYFDNLDVQEEINNKLDELVTNGELKDIVDEYFSNITNIINSISATPIPVDSTSQMTDTSKIYVNTTDGHWYYYNGAQWIQSGLYQSTGISRNQIESYNIKNLSYEKVDTNIQNVEIISNEITNLNNCTLSSNDDTHTIRITNRNSNNQFRVQIPIQDNSKNLRVYFNISNCRIKLTVNIFNSAMAVKSPIYNCLCNGESYVDISKDDFTNTNYIILIFTLYTGSYPALSDNDIWLSFNKILKLSNSSYSDFPNLANKLNSIEKYSGITNKNDLFILNNLFGNTDNIRELTISNLYKNFIITTSGNSGIETTESYIKSGFLHVKGKVTNIVEGTTLVCYLALRKSGGGFSYIPNRIVSDTFDLIYDLSYYSVYDTFLTFRVIFACAGSGNPYNNVTIEDIEIYLNDMENFEIYDNNLEGVITKTENAISNIKTNKLDKIFSSPNGTKYMLAINNQSQVVAIPISKTYEKGLFIGNSLLLGFGTHGMASYSVNDDYYHYVCEHIKEDEPTFESSKFQGVPWESATNSTEVTNFLESIDSYLTNDLDIVIIQLGDNCNTTERVEYIPTKGSMLIEKIRTNSPNAVIVWVASWYNSSRKQELLLNLCNNYAINYINISDLNTLANRAKIGDTYIDSNGVQQTITNGGVASHPSSVGMLAIANRIIENI